MTGPGEGFSIWTPRNPRTVRIDVEPTLPARPDPRLDRAWNRLRIENPRHHDGPILSMVDLDAPAGRGVVRRDWYRRLAVPAEEGGGAILLAVRGLLTAHDRHSRRHVLLGRRNEETRMYGGTWEFAPAGGVDPPAAEQERLDLDDLVAELGRELHEEAGLAPVLDGAELACFCLDRAARGLDVVLRCHLGRLDTDAASVAAAGDHWDTDRTAWIPIDQLPAFAAPPDRISPVTAALGRWLGWL